MNKINELAQKLSLNFLDNKLLKEALTHSSYANENGGECNERLEFLGDAVLELCMSKHLIKTEKIDEGAMTKKRAQSVREEALVIYAGHLQLSQYILLGNGEEKTGGRERPAIIADAFEAVLGAVFETFGFDKTYEVFEKIVLPYAKEVLIIKDYKSHFQELVQADKRSISYEIENEEGPSHDRTYTAIVKMDTIIMGRGSGKSKKDAEQEAAKKALDKLADSQ